MKKNIEVEGGVYCIYTDFDKRVYIGSSLNLNKRFKQHINGLKNNSHRNSHLQNFVSKYGVDKLKFKVLEKCSMDELLVKEQFYIDNYDNVNLFNISKIAGKVEMTDEVRKKISESSKGKIISKQQREKARINGLGKKAPLKTRLKQSIIMKEMRKNSSNYPTISNNRKLTQEQANEIRRLLNKGVKGRVLAKKYNVDPTTISNIKNDKYYVN